jgi:hypothetical protein
MTAHVVLFRVSRTLSADDREAFAASIERAFSGIPLIQRATVGRRIQIGAGYEAGMEHYDYIAVLEFQSEEDLRGYLAHPAHVDMGTRFFTSSEAVLVYDFATVPGDRLRELIDPAIS